MNKFVDLKLTKKGYYYDISFNSEGKIEVNDDFITAFLVSYFTEVRAGDNEQYNEPERRGWWGNLYREQNNLPDLGSKFWLLDQAQNNQDNLNYAKSYLSQCLQWLIDNKYASRVVVEGSLNFETLNLNAIIFRNNSVINEINIELWGNTLKSIEVTNG